MTIRELLLEGRKKLAAGGVETPRLDAEVLLMAALGVDRAGLYASLPEAAPPQAVAVFEAAIARRLAGEPVAYITGRREFMGLDFAVDSRVLVPRPETEGLVEWALARLAARSTPARVVDVGTGSGAIAVSLVRMAPPESISRIVASDRSLDALRVAADNVARLAPGNVELVCGNLLDWCRAPLDLVVANLPYLRQDQAHLGIAREPAVALYAERSGFGLYEELLPRARALLRPGGAIGCEIDPSQREVARAVAIPLFPAATVTIAPDLAGLDRYLLIET